MDENYSKGQRLFLETIDSTVEGVFHSIDPGHNKITLKRVILHPSGKQLDGLYHYYRNEVQNIRVLEPYSYTGVNKDNEAAGEWNLMRKVQSSVLSNKPLGKVTEADVVMNLMPGHGNRSAANRKDKFNVDEYDKLMKLTQNSVLIDRIGDIFKQAIEDISKESRIGVHVEGARFGRRSKVGLLCILTPVRVFLFDVQTLGESGFQSGLRNILENTKIEKVIHNCRLISDCLLHVHKVTLNFVFDTQVGDMMVTQSIYGSFPRCVRSLPECLARYLHLPENLIYKPEVRNGYIAMDCAKWMKRPLPLELQAAAAKSTVFLLQLHNNIYEEMMKPFNDAVNVFCSVVRDADEMEASEHEANNRLVPSELLSPNDQKKNG